MQIRGCKNAGQVLMAAREFSKLEEPDRNWCPAPLKTDEGREIMNIAGLDKAEVLAALYNGSRQQGVGVLHARGADAMSVEQARNELSKSQTHYFDYLHGRVMKVDLKDDEIDTRLYNRDNGEGAAEKTVEALLQAKVASKKMKP